MRYTLLISLLALICCSCSDKDSGYDNNNRLWYRYPAKYWNSQALHLGNGYFGASFYGAAEKEVFALSEKSMWTGGPANGNWKGAGVNPDAATALPLIRKAVLAGETQKADKLITDRFFGSSELFGNFTSVGNLEISFLNHAAVPTEYERELDLNNSTGLVRYVMGKTTFEREYFCSYPDRMLAMRFTADRPKEISLKFTMDIVQDSSDKEIAGTSFKVRGFIDKNHRPFVVLIRMRNHGGVVSREGDYLAVRDADSVELYLTIATNYKMQYPDYTGGDPEESADNILSTVDNNSYSVLKTRHISDYKSLYDRVKLTLEGNPEAEKLPTDERYNRIKSGEPDPGYKALAFNLGRYMIISSSRPHTLPANLQGVWNIFKVAPWAGNYQSNINLQEIYWSCGPLDLAECQQSYIDWIDNLSISGREIAKRIYGTNGWVSHTTGNIWGHAAPIGGHPWGMYPMGAAWHCQHIWDQFAFTQDMEYLERQAYPLLKDASIFWLENLISYKGHYITAPTVSAEHGALMTEKGLNPAFHDSISDKYHYSIPGVYQDMEMIWDLLTNTSAAAKLLGDAGFADSLLRVRNDLMPLKIGKHGQLQEWFEDIDDPECHHRHNAHLYAVCPGNQIGPFKSPELAAAAKVSLNMRGDGRFPMQELAAGGNWARAHRMWCWTRLLDGNRANKIMTEMLTEEGFENGLTFQHAEFGWGREDLYKEGDLFCHFQLDGSASVPGCIAEMLLQSQNGEIFLLPALPDELKTGKITGLKARGGYTVNLEWKDMELTSAEIFTENNRQAPVIRLKNEIIDPADCKTIKFIRLEN